MARALAVVIQQDPRTSHRPVEALRIALGLAAGEHDTTVVLLEDAPILLSEDTDDIIDVDVLEKYLPSFEQLAIPFLIVEGPSPREIRGSFSVRAESPAAIRRFIHRMDRVLVF